MAFGYDAHQSQGKRPPAPTPFHHPPRPVPERSRTAPVSINTGPYHPVPPPPLPPPRHIDTRQNDLGWHMANREGKGLSSLPHVPVRPGSSLLGGGNHTRPPRPTAVPERKVDIVGVREAVPTAPPPAQIPREQQRREQGPQAPSTRTQPQAAQASHSRQSAPPKPATQVNVLKEKDEVVPASPPYTDLRGLMEYNHGKSFEADMKADKSRPSSKLQSEKHMSNDTQRRSSQAYDQQVISKIGAQQSPKDTASRPAEQPMIDMQNALSRLNGQLANFGASVGTPPPALRSPLSDSTLDHAPLPSFPRQYSQRQQENTQAPRNPQNDRFNTPGMAGLSLADRSPPSSDYQLTQTGQKRRANSPPAPHAQPMQSPPAQDEAWRRSFAELHAGRPPHVQRYNPAQTQSPMSSVASPGVPGSYLSSFSQMSQPSTAATSYTSNFMPGSYQAASGALQSPSSLSQYPSQLGAQPMTMSGLGLPAVGQRKGGNGVMRGTGVWICDCCPKKPRKFDTEQDLRMHEMEKQYICQFCHNRFKNKNEAERHQNSLHLRKHSWSCSVLTSFEDAFHPTPVNTLQAHLPPINKPPSTEEEEEEKSYKGLHSTATDTCGYCGQEFINPPNWEDRVNHLNQVHKFGECNQTKKFFRADHFRQHLKHSHAGTSGKWTNELEKACMKDEPPPQPLPGMPSVPNALPGGQPGIIMVGQQALLQQQQLAERQKAAELQAQQAQAQAQAAQAAAQQQHERLQQNAPARSPTMPSLAPVQQYTQAYQPAAQHQHQQQHQQQQRYGVGSPERQAQSLAEHLQQAQREMSEKLKQEGSPLIEGQGHLGPPQQQQQQQPQQHPQYGQLQYQPSQGYGPTQGQQRQSEDRMEE